VFEDLDEPAAVRRASAADLLARAGLGGVPRSALVGVAILVGLAVGIAGWRLVSGSSDVDFAYESGAAEAEAQAAANGAADGSSATGGTGEDAETADTAKLWVHVAGAVRSPGLYELPGGARVGTALAAAGGVSEQGALDAINLARLLSDGEQVYVPTADEVASGSVPVAGDMAGAFSAGDVAASDGIDINLASAAELQALPGIGPATADKIVADREANGPFTTPEDIVRVAGIGEKKFEAIRDLIVVR